MIDGHSPVLSVLLLAPYPFQMLGYWGGLGWLLGEMSSLEISEVGHRLPRGWEGHNPWGCSRAVGTEGSGHKRWAGVGNGKLGGLFQPE